MLLLLIQTNSYQNVQKWLRNTNILRIIHKNTIAISKQKTGFKLLKLIQNRGTDTVFSLLKLRVSLK